MSKLQIENVVNGESNEDNGGYLISKVVSEDGVERFVMFGFDFGDSLGLIELVEKKEGGEFTGFQFTSQQLEDVYNEDEVDCLWNMDVSNEQ